MFRSQPPKSFASTLLLSSLSCQRNFVCCFLWTQGPLTLIFAINCKVMRSLRCLWRRTAGFVQFSQSTWLSSSPTRQGRTKTFIPTSFGCDDGRHHRHFNKFQKKNKKKSVASQSPKQFNSHVLTVFNLMISDQLLAAASTFSKFKKMRGMSFWADENKANETFQFVFSFTGRRSCFVLSLLLRCLWKRREAVLELRATGPLV